MKIAPTEPIPNFGRGWLHGFRHRFNIKSRKKYGEASIIDLVELETQLVPLRLICDTYLLTRTYNFNETGLFWKSTPDASYSAE